MQDANLSLILRLMPFYFYLARCSDNSLYAGSCVNLKAREVKHNEGIGAKYTRSRRPIRIIYSEAFQTPTEARHREAQVKTWSKIKKERLACGKHPTK
jgi:putative endonuclease